MKIPHFKAAFISIHIFSIFFNGSYHAGFEQGESIGFENGVRQTLDTAAANMTSFLKSQNKSDEEIIHFLMNSFSFTYEEAVNFLSRHD